MANAHDFATVSRDSCDCISSDFFIAFRSDPFSIDMMPEATPSLLTQLPEDDAPTEEEYIHLNNLLSIIDFRTEAFSPLFVPTTTLYSRI